MPQNIIAKVPAQGVVTYVGLGFIPDWVKIYECLATYSILEWNIGMAANTLIAGGIVISDTTTDATDRFALARSAGVEIYRGGDRLTSTPMSTPRPLNASAQTSDNMYYGPDTSPDKRDAGTAGTISSWTLGSSTNRTGNWDYAAEITNTGTDDNPVGVGSMINIDGKETYITTLTDQGESANEVALNEALATGPIYMLTGRYTHVAQPAGTITKAGIIINDTTHVNVGTTDDTMIILAGTFR